MAEPRRYWWVNQNQTHREEIAGGSMWSSKQNANGARNQFYANMLLVAPGDIDAPHVDHLFDRGWISFIDDGELLISPHLNPDALAAW